MEQDSPVSTTLKLYRHLVDGEGERRGDEEAAPTEASNFLTILSSQFLTKVGDALVSPKTTLSWITSATGAPLWMLGLLVPIRESGSLIPQLAIAGLLRRQSRRKWTWVMGSLVQALCVMGLALVSLRLEGAAAGYAILGLLACFSLARGFCSVASKDVLGKSVRKSRRGQLNGWAASAAGLVTVAFGLLLLVPGEWSDASLLYPGLLCLAGGLWVVAALVYARVKEAPGETDGGGELAAGIWQRLGLLGRDAGFRHFVIARALLMCSALSAPFYVALAQQKLGSPAYLLGLFLVAAGMAGLCSGAVWGRLADRSSRRVMVLAGGLAAAVGLALFGFDLWLPGLLDQALVLPLAYFILSVAHSGIRVGRKTYVVDMAEGNRRTDYVSVSNSLIGVLLLLTGLLSAMAASIGVSGIILVLSLLCALGALISWRLALV